MKNLKKKIQKKFADAKGFTLIELVVVIIIIGILSAIAVPSYTAYVDRGHKAADLTELDAILTAVDAAFADTEYDIAMVEVDIDPTTGSIEYIIASVDYDNYCYLYAVDEEYSNYIEEEEESDIGHALDFAYYYTGDDSATDADSLTSLLSSSLPALTSDHFLTDDEGYGTAAAAWLEGYEWMNADEIMDNLYFVYDVLGYYDE